MSHPPPLNAIRVFVIAARLQSFKKAAAALFVTPGAVSRQIQTLEEHLGMPLFERKFREIRLTQMGELYLSQVGPAVEAIDSATQRIQDLTRRATVRVDSTPTFAMYWLIPRLAQFHAAHPDIEVRLTTSQGIAERGKDVDLFIRRDPKQFNGMDGQSFMTEWSSIVCSPDLANWKRLRTPQAIVQSTLITMRSRADLWPKWFALHGLNVAQVKRHVDLDNTILAIQAVIEGLGIGLMPCLFLDGLLKAQTLVCPPGAAPLSTGAYHVLQARKNPALGAHTFARWLQQAAAADGSAGPA